MYAERVSHNYTREALYFLARAQKGKENTLMCIQSKILVKNEHTTRTTGLDKTFY